METAIQITQLIVLVLMTFLLTYTLINLIRDRIEEKKAQRSFNKTIENISNTLVEKIKDAKVEVKDNKMSVEETNNYDNMNISELKKVAQKKKIKGYYNLKKDELVKILKETEILPE